MRKAILGISAFYHDSAAALIVDGEIIAAAQEERFTRIKHDASFPKNAVEYVLQEAGLDADDLHAIAFYDKPLLKFERLLETYHAFAPKGLSSFLKAMPVWIKEKLFIKKTIRKELKQISNKVPVLFPEHHLSHAASAFYPSPFQEAAILTIDGVGEWATTTICHGNGKSIKILRELQFPHSIGLLYSAFTYYLGFRVNSGEYKLMGLAPYGNPAALETENFKQKIFNEIVDLRQDGSVILNMEYFNYAAGLTMTNDTKWELLISLPRRTPETPLNQSHMNLALAAQQVLEEIVIRLARTAKEITGSKNLVMAGGVALNCVANSKIVEEKIFENVWIQPAAGDAGGALGAALAAWHIWANEERRFTPTDKMQAAYLGPRFGDAHIRRIVHKYGAIAESFDSFEQLTSVISKKIADGKVVGWFQDRMEFGPRALGNRSILADPRNPAMQKQLNLKIKSREGFRPFAPSVLAEDAACHFENAFPSPYMLFVSYLKKHLRKPQATFEEQKDMYERLNSPRSVVPAITHLDFSARVQTVDKTSNPKFWQLIHDFKKLTGCSMLINTSFNVRGEPIVCTAIDAYRCFMRTEMDYLVIENYVFDKTTQPEFEEKTLRFEPD